MSWSAGSAGTSDRRAAVDGRGPIALRIIHLSDVHVWRYSFNPFHLANKRAVGMVELVTRRAKNFRLERLMTWSTGCWSGRRPRPDHRRPDDDRPAGRVPGRPRGPGRAAGRPGPGHGRARQPRPLYDGLGAPPPVRGVVRRVRPRRPYPWLRRLDDDTAVLGLDATRSHISATGLLPARATRRGAGPLADPASRPRRLIVACHYPVAAPRLRKELSSSG